MYVHFTHTLCRSFDVWTRNLNGFSRSYRSPPGTLAVSTAKFKKIKVKSISAWRSASRTRMRSACRTPACAFSIRCSTTFPAYGASECSLPGLIWTGRCAKRVSPSTRSKAATRSASLTRSAFLSATRWRIRPFSKCSIWPAFRCAAPSAQVSRRSYSRAAAYAAIASRWRTFSIL